MVIKNNRKGQAAIEFLMTYGWMLLVVLIVGALIFSFVDFGSLLPNKIQLNNNLRASATESAAFSSPTDPERDVVIVFSYNGARKVEIAADAGEIDPSINSVCNSTYIENVDTEGNATGTDYVAFLTGQTGFMYFDCPSGELLEGDVIEGDLQINVRSSKTGLETPTSGPIRLAVN